MIILMLTHSCSSVHALVNHIFEIIRLFKGMMCIHVCTYVCMYVWSYVCMYGAMYVCMYVRTYVCMYEH